jgi:hypothetical protein
MIYFDSDMSKSINTIENVQSEAARIATSGTKLTSIQRLYEEIKVITKLPNSEQSYKTDFP